MIYDLATILWKELKELLFQSGQGRSSLLRHFIFVGVFGVMLPLQNGPEAIHSAGLLVFWAWVPYLLASGVTADTFAGERERHTLETLLASRLSDRSILFGKLAAVVVYAWGQTLLAVLISLVTINVAHWSGQIVLYSARDFAAILSLSLLVTVLSAGLGVAISLRASSARAAQQTLSIIIFVLVIPLYGASFLPREWLAWLNRLVEGLSVEQLIAGAVAVLFVLDAGLLAYALSRFQRARLILD